MNCFRFLVFLMLVAPLPLRAEPGYAEHPQADDFVLDMTRNYGFEDDHVRHWLGQARHQERIIELISKPAERSLEWHEYRRLFIKPERTRDGQTFLTAHKHAFDRAESEYGVPREIIGAVIGVETWYGRYRGSHRVLDALATLAFDYPPRSTFFRSELQQFLLMAREQGFAPDSLKGSYAGAMGYGQFIASSYRNFAVDFDGDGAADIIDNPVDAIGSVANYFREHHWKTGGPVAVRLADDISVPDKLMTGELRPRLTVSDYRSAGIALPDSLDDAEPARIIRVQGEGGPQWWLTCHNFYVITRYNHSHLYALAVNALAETLQKARADTDPGTGNNDNSNS